MTQWGVVCALLANFRRLVLSCIEAEFCNQILIFEAFFEIYSRAYRAKKKCTHFSSPEKKEHLAEIKGGRFCG